jgi:hypothetical protein
MKRRAPNSEWTDPDPLVIDLLVGLAGTAIAGGIKKAAEAIFAAARRRWPTTTVERTPPGQLQQLRRELEELERRLSVATTLVGSGRRELGGVVVLDQNRLQQYHELREGIFDQLRRLDELVESFGAVGGEVPARPGRRRTALPKEFRDRLKYVDHRLRDARSATLAGEAFLDVSSAVGMLRQILDLLEQEV